MRISTLVFLGAAAMAASGCELLAGAVHDGAQSNYCDSQYPNNPSERARCELDARTNPGPNTGS